MSRVIRVVLIVQAGLQVLAAVYVARFETASAGRPSVSATFFLALLLVLSSLLLYARSLRGTPTPGEIPQGWLVLLLTGAAVLCQVILLDGPLDLRSLALLSGFALMAVVDDTLSLHRRPERWMRLRYAPFLAVGWMTAANLAPVSWMLLLLATAVPVILSGDRAIWVLLAVAASGAVVVSPSDPGIRDLAWAAAGSVMIFALAIMELFQRLELGLRSKPNMEPSAAVYREICDALAEGIIVVDRESRRILKINRKAADFLGQAAVDLVGAHLDHLAGLSSWIGRVLAHPGALVELEPGAAPGYSGWIEAQFLICQIAGESRGLLVMRDITERVAAEQERKRLEEELLYAQKMESIGRLAGGIAHDFNNLLTVINGRAELAASLLEKDHPAMQEVARIRQAGLRAAELTGRLLAFSRKQAFELTQVCLNQVIEEIAHPLRQIIGEDVELIIRLEPQLRAVRADAGRIQQVVLNLVVNARDAMPEGGRLLLATENLVIGGKPAPGQPPDLPPGRFVTLTVQDTGHGMGPEVLNRIFEPFFTTKQVGQGSGLGLSVVHGIVQEHGGRIAVKSVPGAGSTFIIYLPAVDPLPEEVEDVARRFAQGR
jgi:signal transduction histidine kinase